MNLDPIIPSERARRRESVAHTLYLIECMDCHLEVEPWDDLPYHSRVFHRKRAEAVLLTLDLTGPWTNEGGAR